MRKRTTIYLDAELLGAVAALAKASGRHNSEIVEDALRRYLPDTREGPRTQGLREALGRVGEASELGDEEALDLAYSELRSVRRARSPQ